MPDVIVRGRYCRCTEPDDFCNACEEQRMAEVDTTMCAAKGCTTHPRYFHDEDGCAWCDCPRFRDDVRDEA